MRPDAALVEKRQQGHSRQPHYEAAYEWPSRCLSAIVLSYVLAHIVLSVIDELETLAPVVAVQGNIEYEEVVAKLPIKREIMVGNCCIGIVHILGDSHNRVKVARQGFPQARVVVFGHSHIPWNEDRDGQLLFNPGSATDRQRQPKCSIGMLYVDDDTTIKNP